LHRGGLCGAGRLPLGGLANVGSDRLLVVLLELGLVLPFVHLGSGITRAEMGLSDGWVLFVEEEVERAGRS
jgi:hypothetical protein